MGREPRRHHFTDVTEVIFRHPFPEVKLTFGHGRLYIDDADDILRPMRRPLAVESVDYTSVVFVLTELYLYP